MARVKLERAEVLIYSALTGINIGVAAAVLLAQWTWLEMRFNTGLCIPVGFLVGILVGWLKEKTPSALCGWVSAVLLVVTTLGITGGNLGFMEMVIGTVVREGVNLDDLSITVVNFVVLGVLVLTLALTVHLTYLKRNKTTRLRVQNHLGD